MPELSVHRNGGNVSVWAGSQITKRIRSQIKELRYSIVGIKTSLHLLTVGVN